MSEAVAGVVMIGVPVLFNASFALLAQRFDYPDILRRPTHEVHLARMADQSEPTSARGEAVDAVFQSLHRYLGVAVGEHLGYALTGAWSVISGVALIQESSVPGWLGVIGLVIGPLFLISAAEFVGPFEPSGWKLAGQLTPIAYILWSLWLIAVGIALLT